MSRKSRGKKPNRTKVVEAVPEEILAEGSGPVVEGVVAHVGIDQIAADELEPVLEPEPTPTTVEELAVAVEELVAMAHASSDVVEPADDASGERASFDAADAPDASAAPDAPDGSDAPAADAVADAIAADGVDADGLDADANAAVAAAAAGADSLVDAAAPDALVELTDEEAAEIGAVLPTSAASMDAAQLKFLVESLVFASDKPMTLVRLRQLTRVGDTRRLEQSLAELAEDYKERGIVLQQVSGGYQFRTRTQFSSWVQQLIAGRPVRLSRAQLETLAIIAYRQPITRPEIDEIRGVDSSATLKLLLDRSLIRILGKKEEVGRPMLYGTTKEFLDFFSLGDLRELPTLREYSELTDESRRVMSDELGIDPDDDGGSSSGGGSDGGGGGDDMDLDPIEAKPESIEDMVASYSASMDETSSADGSSVDASSVNASSVDASSVDESSVDASSVDASSVDASSVDESSVDESSVDESSVDESSLGALSVEASSVDASSVDASSVEVSWVDASSVDAVDTSSVDESSVDESSLDASSLDASSVEASSVDESSLDASSLDASPVDESSLDASPVEASSVEASSVDESSVDASSVEVSWVDTSSVDAVDTSSVDESSVDASSVDVSSVDASSVDASSVDASSVDESAQTGVFEATDEAATTGVFEANASAADMSADDASDMPASDMPASDMPASEQGPLDLAAATATLESLAARRVATHDESGVEDDVVAPLDEMDSGAVGQSDADAHTDDNDSDDDKRDAASFDAAILAADASSTADDPTSTDRDTKAE